MKFPLRNSVCPLRDDIEKLLYIFVGTTLVSSIRATMNMPFVYSGWKKQTSNTRQKCHVFDHM